MGRISLRGVTKRFGATVAVDDLTLEAEDHELLVLLGPSGCGKSTVLRLVAGLDEPDAGEIEIAGRVANGVEPEARDVAMVFQSYALYPHMDVRRNIAFPLRARRVPKDEQARAVAEAARALGLSALLDRKPAQLSGGQRQRVALARAIVRQPAAFLMDEPLSNLDAKLRVQTRAELIELQRRLAATILYVTHDQVEAMTMGHRIAVLNEGRLQQVGAPAEMYDRPANLFVARFLGSPPMNTIRDGSVVIGIRPEHVQLGATGERDATVSVVESLGHERHVVCRLDDADGTMVIARRSMDEAVPDVGERVGLTADATRVHRFDATTGERIAA